MMKILQLLIIFFVLEFEHSNGQHEIENTALNSIRKKRGTPILDKTENVRNVNVEHLDRENYRMSKLSDDSEYDAPGNSDQLPTERKPKTSIVGGVNINITFPGGSGSISAGNRPKT